SCRVSVAGSCPLSVGSSFDERRLLQAPSIEGPSLEPGNQVETLVCCKAKQQNNCPESRIALTAESLKVVRRGTYGQRFFVLLMEIVIGYWRSNGRSPLKCTFRSGAGPLNCSRNHILSFSTPVDRVSNFFRDVVTPCRLEHTSPAIAGVRRLLLF